MAEGFGLGRLSGRRLVVLWAILSVGLSLRILALDWGLPPSGPERAAAGLRSSYAAGEGAVLDALSRTDPARLDFDPHLYRWGTLHLSLTLAALETAEAAGAFDEPWRESWRGMSPAGFERVYVVGRALSVLVDLGSALLAALIALRLAGDSAALWAAALVAASPGHIVQSGQIRVDVTAAACLLLLILAVLARRAPMAVGMAAGLAVAAKYSVAPLALAAVAVDCAYRGWAGRRLLWIGVGAALGFLAGEPWLLSNGAEVVREVFGEAAGLFAPGFVASAPGRIGTALLDMARFSVGLPAAALAAAGMAVLWRRGGLEGRLLPVVFGAGLLALVPRGEPLLRDHLPLAPLAAIAAAAAIVAAGRWSKALGAAALFVAASASLAAVSYRIAPHPANLALQVLERAAKPGQTVSLTSPRLPPLDRARHPAGPNPLTDDLQADPPDWVVVSDLPAVALPRENERFLRESYEPTAAFRPYSRSSWATIGERGAPMDWKYSHPRMTIYRRR